MIESGLGESCQSVPPQSADASVSAERESGIGASAAAETSSGNSSESPAERLKRLERLREHLKKMFNRFNPHEILTQLQCPCEVEKW